MTSNSVNLVALKFPEAPKIVQLVQQYSPLTTSDTISNIVVTPGSNDSNNTQYTIISNVQGLTQSFNVIFNKDTQVPTIADFQSAPTPVAQPTPNPVLPLNLQDSALIASYIKIMKESSVTEINGAEIILQG